VVIIFFYAFLETFLLDGLVVALVAVLFCQASNHFFFQNYGYAKLVYYNYVLGYVLSEPNSVAAVVDNISFQGVLFGNNINH
jgi:hypothetical protein